MNDAAGYFYRSRVMHTRRYGHRYRFTYDVGYLLLDIDRIGELDERLRLFSHNRFNLFGFYTKDHGPRDGMSLRPWLESMLAPRGIDLSGGRIRLLCMPRLLGYVFNPISIYFCEHEDGQLRAILCQVHNTFGERHYYLLDAQGAPLDYAGPHAKPKRFHVSPLLDVAGDYVFCFEPPQETFAVRIALDNYKQNKDEESGPLLVTTLCGERRSLTDSQLFNTFLRMPLMTVKVISAIHWQAFKLWLRGAKTYRKPVPPEQKVS